jgi:hypothetical protein
MTESSVPPASISPTIRHIQVVAQIIPRARKIVPSRLGLSPEQLERSKRLKPNEPAFLQARPDRLVLT